MYKKLLLMILFLLPTAVNSQNDVNNRFMLANSYEQAGEFEKARSILEELYQKTPDNYQVFDALNRVYIQLKKYDASAEMLNKKISANPQDVNLYGLLGKTYHLKGDEKKAFEIWDKALEMETGNFMVYRLVANYALERRAFAKAIEVLEKGKNKAPDPAVFSYDLANLYQLTMNYTNAAEEYISLLQKAPQDIHNIRERINGYISKPEALKKTLAVFESRSVNSAEFKSLLAWLYTQDRNYEEAYKIYSELDEQRGSGGGDIFNFAQLLYSIKEYEIASKVYSDIVENYSSSPLINAAKLGYAKSVEAIIEGKEYGSSGSWKPLKKSASGKTGETDKLIQTYLDLSKKSQNNDLSNEAAYRAARIYIYRQNNYSGGEEILKKIVNDFPVSAFAPGAALDLGFYEKLLAKFPNSLYLDEAREEIILIRNKAS
jgi:tetratricopeptide (TPR) repeat protein